MLKRSDKSKECTAVIQTQFFCEAKHMNPSNIKKKSKLRGFLLTTS